MGNLKLRLTNTQFSLMLITPAFVIVGFVILYPLVRGILLGFTEFTLLNPITTLTLKNYKYLLGDKIYWEVFLNTINLTFAAVALQVIIGLVLALLLNQQIRGRNIFRGIVLINWIIPLMVVSLLWMWIFNEQFGILNYILKKLHLINRFLPWLGEPSLAQLAVIITNVWRGMPFMMVMFLAGLQTIPEEIIDAAKIDGAGTWARFKAITLPYLRQIFMIASLLSIIRLFQDFTVIWILTAGGPIYATTTFCIHVYKIAFESFAMGQAAAIGTTWLIFLFIFAALYIWILARRGTEFY